MKLEQKVLNMSLAILLSLSATGMGKTLVYEPFQGEQSGLWAPDN